MKSAVHVLALALSALMGAPAASASMVLSLGSQTIAADGTATIDLDVSGLEKGAPLGTFDVNVGFDPGIVSFLSASYGDPVKGDQLNLSGFGPVTLTTPGAGMAELFEVSLDSSDTLVASQASSFTLAQLMFNAVAPGTSALTLSVNALGDQNGNSLEASLQNGSVTVAPVPLPASWSLLVSALLGGGAFLRRRSVILA